MGNLYFSRTHLMQILIFENQVIICLEQAGKPGTCQMVWFQSNESKHWKVQSYRKFGNKSKNQLWIFNLDENKIESETEVKMLGATIDLS